MADTLWSLFLIFIIFNNISLALKTIVEYNFEFKCGKQPITGELIVEKGDTELLKVDFTRADQNKFKESREYLDFPNGAFKLILRTGCGALSKIGELCHHKYTTQPFMQQHGTSKFLVFRDNVNLHHEIENHSDSIELVCK